MKLAEFNPASHLPLDEGAHGTEHGPGTLLFFLERQAGVRAPHRQGPTSAPADVGGIPNHGDVVEVSVDLLEIHLAYMEQEANA
jgi:hypothetical protein